MLRLESIGYAEVPKIALRFVFNVVQLGIVFEVDDSGVCPNKPVRVRVAVRANLLT